MGDTGRDAHAGDSRRETPGFAVYSTDYEPRRLYSSGDPDAVDTGRVAEVVGFGARPLDLYVDLGADRLLWSFKADRHTKSTRTGYFVAAYRADGDLFRGFEAELRRLHDSDDWAVPYAGEPRWDIGFDLWRVPPEVPGLSQAAFERLASRVGDGSGGAPMEFGMASHRTAAAAVKALAAADVDCTVAVGTGGESSALTDADLLLSPDADADFDPRTPGAREVVRTDASRPDSGSSPGQARGDADTGTLPSRVGAAAIMVCLVFAAYSFVSPTPVRPITGLATLGGFVGASLALVGGQAIRTVLGAAPTDPVEVVRDAFLSDPDWSVPVLAYGTVLGFVFPRAAWQFGVVLGRGGFPFGTITGLPGAFLTVTVYTAAVFALSACAMVLQRARGGRDALSVTTLAVAVVGHFAYALGLFLATGFAGSLWFLFVPSATA